MRKQLLISFMSISVLAISQDKGFVSGTVAFSTETISSDGYPLDLTNTSVLFGPAIGFNLGTSNVVGLALNVQQTTNETAYFGSSGAVKSITKRSLIEVAPFFRRMMSVGDKCSIYGQVLFAVGAGSMNTEIDNSASDTEADISNVRVAIGPGIFYHFSDHWAASADWGALGYSNYKETEKGNYGDIETTTTGLELRVDPGAITFALNYVWK